jgi:hypothetical protein
MPNGQITKTAKMKTKTQRMQLTTLSAALVGLAATLAVPAKAVDLLQRYPTALTAGILEPSQARLWQFTPQDIFSLSRFHLEVGQELKLDTSRADLGIGHCADGAVWAVVVPSEPGKLMKPSGGAPEEIVHIWLRFHPAEINKLFPPDTVSAAAGTGMASQIRTIAGAKFRASYHAGINAMIPDPKDMTVDVDTKLGLRRFYMVDTQAGTSEYVNAFERQPVRLVTRSSGQNPPKIILTKPADGATDVDAGLTEITVTFDQDMSEGFSWTGGGPEYPSSPDGQNAHWRGKRTCVLPVKLESGHHYRVGINAPSYRNFRSAAGDAAEPSSISFTTK